MAETEAARLFVDRARLVALAFALTAPERTGRGAGVPSCLDAIPLALELAAARVAVFSVDQIAARLDQRFRLLPGGNRTALPRHQTRRATIDWSHHLLTEVERTFLRRLAVFAGGWPLDAAEAVGERSPAQGPGRSGGGRLRRGVLISPEKWVSRIPDDDWLPGRRGDTTM